MRLIAIIILALSLAYCSFAVSESSARHYLQRRYASVDTIDKQWIQFSCFRTKDRMKFNFTATRQDGTKVSGYLCYDGPLDIWPSVHEQ